MSDYEIDEIRRIRHQIAAEQGHDLQKIAQYYRNVEEELRESGRHDFADEAPKEVPVGNSKNAV